MKSGRKKIAHQREKRENWCKEILPKLRELFSELKTFSIIG